MESNLNKTALDLYGKLQTRFSDIELGNEKAEVIGNKSDVPEARFFEFEYTDNGRSVGRITITLDQDDGLVVLASGDFANRKHSKLGPQIVKQLKKFGETDDITIGFATKFIRALKEFIRDADLTRESAYQFISTFRQFDYNNNITPNSAYKFIKSILNTVHDRPSVPKSAYEFIRSLRRFAKNHLLKFDIQNIGKNNLSKRDYSFKAQKPDAGPSPNGENEIMNESKLYGSNRISYQDLGEARLVIKHSGAINTENAISRIHNIDSIFIENRSGERFKYPYKHLNGARALGEHIAHGGNPYDSIGKYIIELSEELKHLRTFKNFVNSKPTISESIGNVAGRVVERIDEIKTELLDLQKANYYTQFSESFQESERKPVPESIISDWTDRLTIRTFKEELSNVFPYLYNILDESDLPPKMLTPQDFVTTSDVAMRSRVSPSIKPEDYLTKVLENITVPDQLMNPDTRSEAIDAIIDIFKKGPLLNGEHGSGSIPVIQNIIDDDELYQKLYNTSSDFDVRSLIQDHVREISENLPDPTMADQFKTDVREILDFKIEEEPEQPDTTAEPPATPPPAPTSGAPEILPQARASGELASTPPPIAPPGQPPVAEASFSDQFKFKSRPRFAQKLSRRSAMSRALKRAHKAGAMLETELDFGDRTMTIREMIAECGLKPSDVGYSDRDSEHRNISVLDEFLNKYYNPSKNNLTIGYTKFEQELIQEYRDGAFPDLEESDIHAFLERVKRFDPPSNHHNQITRIRELAGLKLS